MRFPLECHANAAVFADAVDTARTNGVVQFGGRQVADDDRRTALLVTTIDDAEQSGQLELALLGCTDFIEHQQVRANHLTQDVRLGLA
ncbi:hypothetical protein D3C75_777440 [compost metagenome]